MPNLTEYFAGLQVSATEIQRAESLAEQVLKAKYPDMDLREGTGVRDLVIRPFATLLAMLDKGLDFHFSQNTLDGVTDESPESLVDSIMSNWFLYRNLGSNAVINARLFFARSKNITLPADTFFSPDNVLKFNVGATTYLEATSLVLDTFNNEYYIDIDLTAESAGVDYNISSGSLLYFSNFDPFFLRAEINYLALEASDPETNTQFLERAREGISTRNLINIPSIISNIQERYPSVTHVLPVGFSDAEMIRDQVSAVVPSSVDPVLIHIGGKVDVYCRTKLEKSIVQLVTDANGKCFIPGPVIDFSRSLISGGADADEVPLYVTATVSSLIGVGTTMTVTTLSPHGFNDGDLITILGATPSHLNTTAAITYLSTTTFEYTVALGFTGTATGTITARKPLPFTQAKFGQTNYTITDNTSITSTGTTVTVAIDNHGFSTNRYVSVSNAVQPEYNGSYLVTSATKDTLTYVVPVAPSVSPATGTITVGQTAFDNDIGFSDRNNETFSIIGVDFGVLQANKTASFEVLRFRNLPDIQGYLESNASRVLCADLLARGNNLYYLSVNVTAYNGPSPDATTCETIINNYLDTLEPGEPFIMSDLISMLDEGGIESIKTPLDVTYKRYTRDMILPPPTGTITDVLDPNDRTSVFYLETVTTSNSSF